MRLLWDNCLVGSPSYYLASSYDYGYNDKRPLFYNSGGKLISYPTEYCKIWKQSLPKRKTKDEFRIFVLGSSVSRGNERSNFSVVLERILHETLPGRDWHVINLSVNSYGSARILLSLKKTIQYGPDLFIIMVSGPNEKHDKETLAYKQALNTGLHRLVYASHFIVVAKKWLTGAVHLENALSFAADDESVVRDNLDEVQMRELSIYNNIDAMVTIARSHRIPVILMGMAAGYANTFNRAGRTNNIIKKFSNNRDVFYFDTASMVTDYVSSGARTSTFFTGDGTHWTDDGHKLIAHKLYDCISRQLVK